MKFPVKTIAFFVVYIAVEVAESKLKRPRGVSIAKASLYPFSDTFVCFDGSATIKFENINDDYCDCADGSDEPGTAACPNGTFDCINIGFQSKSISSMHVNDGICDCCDGSDEYNSRAHCVNRCFEIVRQLRDEVDRLHRQSLNLYELYKEYGKEGQKLKREKLQQLEVLTKQKKELEHVQVQLKTLKDEAEKQEQEALDLHEKLLAELESGERCVLATPLMDEVYSTASTQQSLSLSAEDSVSAEDRSTIVGQEAMNQQQEANEDTHTVKQTAEVIEQAVEQMEAETSQDEQAVKHTPDVVTATETVEQTVAECDDKQAMKDSEMGVGDVQAVKQIVAEMGQDEEAVKQMEITDKQAVQQTVVDVGQQEQVLEQTDAEMGQVKEAVRHTEVTDKWAEQQTVAEAGQDEQAVHQTAAETGQDKEAVKQAGKQVVTETVECKWKADTLHYSKHALQIIEGACRAREQLKDVSLKLLNIIADSHHCQRFLATDFGPSAEFASLSSQCYESSDVNYTYSLCPFDRVTQHSKLAGLIVLGKWGQWSDVTEQKYRVMQYDNGERCADSLPRSAVVYVECGERDAVTAVTESTACRYQLIFTSPAACSQPPVAPTIDPVYDEL